MKKLIAGILTSSLVLCLGVTSTFAAPGRGRHCTRACLKIHSCDLRSPLCGIFAPHSVDVARYASFIRDKSPTNWEAHLAESNFQTHSSTNRTVTCSYCQEGCNYIDKDKDGICDNYEAKSKKNKNSRKNKSSKKSHGHGHNQGRGHGCQKKCIR